MNGNSKEKFPIDKHLEGITDDRTGRLKGRRMRVAGTEDKGLKIDKELINPEVMEEEESIKATDPEKFIPLEDIPEEIEEDKGNEKLSMDEKEKLFEKLKDEQNQKLAEINSEISFYDIYFRNSRILDDLKRYLWLKGKEQFKKEKIKQAPASLKKDKEEKWREARYRLSDEIVSQGINRERFSQKEWQRPDTSAVLVKKFKLDLLNKQERDILMDVIIEVINNQPKLGRHVAVKFAKAEQAEKREEAAKAKQEKKETLAA
jgi:hypothetical protein